MQIHTEMKHKHTEALVVSELTLCVFHRLCMSLMKKKKCSQILVTVTPSSLGSVPMQGMGFAVI